MPMLTRLFHLYTCAYGRPPSLIDWTTSLVETDLVFGQNKLCRLSQYMKALDTFSVIIQ